MHLFVYEIRRFKIISFFYFYLYKFTTLTAILCSTKARACILVPES